MLKKFYPWCEWENEIDCNRRMPVILLNTPTLMCLAIWRKKEKKKKKNHLKILPV